MPRWGGKHRWVKVWGWLRLHVFHLKNVFLPRIFRFPIPPECFFFSRNILIKQNFIVQLIGSREEENTTGGITNKNNDIFLFFSTEVRAIMASLSSDPDSVIDLKWFGEACRSAKNPHTVTSSYIGGGFWWCRRVICELIEYPEHAEMFLCRNSNLRRLFTTEKKLEVPLRRA